jgi:hypothetical protein
VGFHEVGDALPDMVLGKVGPGARVDSVDVKAAGADAAEVSGEAVRTIGRAGKEVTHLEVGTPVVEDQGKTVRRSVRGGRRLRERLRGSGRRDEGRGPGRRWRGHGLRGAGALSTGCESENGL